MVIVTTRVKDRNRVTIVTEGRDSGTDSWSFVQIFRPGKRESGLVRQFCVFDVHVLEFAGFKDFAAFFAFDEFGVFFTRHNLNARVFAG